MSKLGAPREPVGVLTGLLALAWLGCGGPEPVAEPIRLVDRFSDATIEGTPPPIEPGEPIEWSFSGGAAEGGAWSAGPRTAAIAVGPEGLSGRSVGPFPALFLSRPEPAGEGDRLHRIVVRMRATKGTTLSLTTLGEEGPPSPALAGDRSHLTLRVPLIAGSEFQTYALELDRMFGLGPLARSGVTRVVLRPTDVTGAEFTLASIQLIFRKDHLAGIPTGIGWQGLSQVWRDTVVSRAPQRITWRLDVPPDPWLDLALGTVSEGQVPFEVRVSDPEGGKPVEYDAVHSETLTTAERWQPRRIDLSEYAGRTVDLTLAAGGPEGSLAFWGSPVVRSGWVDDHPPEVPKGIVVVLADTLRKHHLQIYGHGRENTPTLAAMAREGVLFRDAISQATWTKVSVPSILTSLYPTTHQIVTFNDRVPSAAVTLAEALQGAGFATWASSSVPFSGQLTNLHQGVEVLHEEASVRLPEGVSDTKTGRYFIDELEPWLERHRDVPFFAFVHAMDPHSPYRPYRPYDTLWTDEAAAQRYERELDQVRPHIKNRVLRRFGMPSRAEMEAAGIEIEPYITHERAWYDASILALDAEIGRLLEILRRLGRDRDTVIAFVSDHGEEFLEHGNHWHGLNVYSEMIEVPLLLHWPGGLPGTEVESTVQTIDMMPTLLELAGVPIPETAQGLSLRELWSEGGGARRPPAIAERIVQVDISEDPHDVFVGSDSLAIVEQEWKLIWNVRQGPGVPEHELYHRPSDPLDQENRAAAEPEIVARLLALLERWRESAIAARLPSDDAAAENLSAEDLERLKALGYL